MEAAFEFSVNGLNMEFAINLVMNGHSIPDGLFVDILTEKCQLLHHHLNMLVANVGSKVLLLKYLTRTW